jgi:hypothetical protein
MTIERVVAAAIGNRLVGQRFRILHRHHSFTSS